MVISIFSTNANERISNLVIDAAVTTFSELSAEVKRLTAEKGNMIDLSRSNSKITWFAQGDPLHNSSPDSPEAKIPSVENFMISITPFTTNKGADYNEMKAFVKEQRLKAEREKNRTVFEMIGDYTRLRHDEMTRLYNRLKELNTPNLAANTEPKTVITTVSATVNELASMEARTSRLETLYQELSQKLTAAEALIAIIDRGLKNLDTDVNNLRNAVTEDADELDEEEFDEENTTPEVPEEIKDLWRQKGVRYDD